VEGCGLRVWVEGCGFIVWVQGCGFRVWVPGSGLEGGGFRFYMEGGVRTHAGVPISLENAHPPKTCIGP
jgi:hypothetical protein